MIKSKKKFKEFTGYRFEYLERLLPEIEKSYGIKHLPKFDEDGNQRYKLDGTPLTRIVYPSYGELKLIQKKIKKLLNRVTLPEYIHGGVKKKSNITYAKIHLGKKYHFCTDLKDFFPKITHRQVYKMFLNNGCTPDIARLLTRFTTYQGILPQGSPTSTHIANLISLPVDKQINKYCSQHDIYFGRYVDDLAFSSPMPFDEHIENILILLRKSGFAINYKKSFTKIGKFSTTGIVLENNKMDATEKTTKKIDDPNTTEKARNALINYRKRVQNRGE